MAVDYSAEIGINNITSGQDEMNVSELHVKAKEALLKEMSRL